MVTLEIKKNIRNFSFLLSVLLLYLVFLLGDSGAVLLGDNQHTTVIGAIWNKFHGNWQVCSDSSCLVRMYRLWTDNAYLPILMPFLCGLPGAMVYLDEIHTGNKKWILSRCSFRQYYSAKIVANAVSAVLVSAFAVVLYYATLLLFFDKLPISHEEFPLIYSVLTGDWIEDVSAFSVYVICGALLKNLLYFFLYSVMSASICLWIAVWCREKYTVFGATVFMSYLPCRISEELVRKCMDKGNELFGDIADIIDPTFLHYAGKSGLYGDKEWLALGITASIIAFNYGLAVLLSRKYYDVSER